MQRLEWIAVDLRYAVRQLVSSPVFAATAILSLAIPIALNTALFTVFSALLRRPVGASGAGELLRIGRTVGSEPSFRSSDYDEFEYLRDHARSFDAVAGGQIGSVTVVAADGAASASAEVVTGNYLTLLGVRAQLGRLFAADEDRVRNEHPVAVISDRYWRRRFGADPAIAGRTLTINTVAFTVIGVASPGFTGAVFPGQDTDLWMPTMMADVVEPRSQQSLLLLARVKPGIGTDAVTAELDALARGFAEINPARGRNRGFAITPARGVLPLFHRMLRAFLLLLMAAAGAVLLIACANIASLLLARAGARRTELAVRLALGAGRGRVISQLMLESLVIAACGGAAALVLTGWSIDAVNALVLPPGPTGATLVLDLRLDSRVVAFTAAVAVATTLLFGLAPALQATRVDLVAGLKDTRSFAIRRRSRLRGTLVAAQVALSVVLLICAVLLFRGVRHASTLEMGFDPERVVVASFNLQLPGYDRPRMDTFHLEMLRRARLLPGVERAALANFVPMGSGASLPLTVSGVEPQPGEAHDEVPSAFSIPFNRVSPDYFSTIGQPLAAGREFAEGDDATAPRVAVVNEVMANRFWPGQSALGARFRIAGETTDREIVGVARDAVYASFDPNIRPIVYVPVAQRSDRSLTLLVRTAAPTADLAGAIVRLTRDLDPHVAPQGVGNLRDSMAENLLPARIAQTTLSIAGVIALLLASAGLYGLVSYTIAQRVREIGLRMALGATRRRVFRDIAGGAFTLAAGGLAAGVVLAAGASRLLTAFLYGVSPADPLTFGGVACLMLAVTVAAAYTAARRGLNVDPGVALRDE